MRSLPTITKNLLIINVLALLANNLFGAYMASHGMEVDLNSFLGLYYFGSSPFQVYQLVTYMFMHGGWVHLIFNMFALWMFGGIIERVWGGKKFLFYYLVCGVGAGITQELVQMLGWASVYSSTVGASGAIFGILLAFGMLFPDERLFIIPIPFPIKAKWLVIGYGALEVVQAFGASDGVAHFAHLGGMIFGYFLIRYWSKHPGGSGYSTRQDPFGKFRDAYGNWRKQQADSSSRKSTGNERQQDWDYEAQKKRRQEEIDRILDKIRKSGYDSLTQEEKRKLFDQSNTK